MNLVDFLFETKDPDKESVYFNGVHYTRKDIYGKILFTAGKIRSRIRHGERVGLVADNSVFFIASYLGIIEAGGVCVPLYPPRRSRFRCARAAPVRRCAEPVGHGYSRADACLPLIDPYPD